MDDDLFKRMRELEDREAIRELIASYGPLADAGDGDAIAAMWTEDGSYGVGGMGTVRGRPAIAGLMDNPMHRELMADGCAHVLGPVSIDLAGDTATARGHSVVLRHTAGEFTVFRVSANRWDLVRTPQGWLVKHRENALLDGSAAARALLSLPSGRRP